MASVPRPLIALLIGTVAFFALWIVALKPSGSSSSGSSKQGLGQYQAAIAKAHQAVATSDSSNAAAGGDAGSAAASAATTHASASTASAKASASQSTVKLSPAARHRLDVVSRGLVANEVIALLFYNPSATDDRAVKQELATVPADRGHVVKLAVPVGELGRYAVVTTQVPVNVSPTLVLIDRRHQAESIVGFADRFEIAQRVRAALATK